MSVNNTLLANTSIQGIFPAFEKPERGNWVNHASGVMLISSELLLIRSAALA